MLHVRFGRIVFLVAAMAAVGQFANTIYVPAMSMIAQGLHIPAESVQLLMVAYLLPYGLTQFIYGPLSDMYGRRPLVLIGLAIFVVGSVITVFANRFAPLFWGCLIQGVGAGVSGVMARTVMRDCYSDRLLYKANSVISMALIIAPLAAPILGGFISVYWGWRSDFIFLLVLGGATLSMEYALFDETHVHLEAQVKSWAFAGAAYWRVLCHKAFVGYLICLTVSFGGVAVFEASASMLLTDIMHYPASVVSWLFIVPIPGYLIGSYAASYLNRSLSIGQIMRLSIGVMLLGIVALSVPAYLKVINIYVILVPITVYMFGTGLLFPTAVTGALNPMGDIAGSAGALLGGVQNIGAALMTVCFTMIPQTTQRPLALMLDLVALCLLLTYQLFLKKHTLGGDN